MTTHSAGLAIARCSAGSARALFGKIMHHPIVHSRLALRGPTRSARLVAAAIALWWLPARAEPSKEDVAKADELFKHAVKAMDAGRYAEACPLFAESQRIAPGGGTILNLAQCHEAQGLTATAYVEFTEALRVNEAKKRADRIKAAKEHLADLVGRLSYVRVSPPPRMIAETTFVVMIDDHAVDKTWWTEEHPIDPGIHYVEARADGRKAWRTSFQVAPEADHKTLTIPELELPAAAATSSAPIVATAAPSPPRASAPPAHRSSLVPVTASVLLGVGVVGIAAGSLLAVQASNAQGNAQSAHNSDPAKPQSLSDARTMRDWAWGTLSVGTVALGVGGALLWTSLTRSEPAARDAIVPVIGPTFGGVAWTGRF